MAFDRGLLVTKNVELPQNQHLGPHNGILFYLITESEISNSDGCTLTKCIRKEQDTIIYLDSLSGIYQSR